MAQKQIGNLTPVIFLSPTAQLEILQDGTTFRTSAQQIADLANFKIHIVNNTSNSNSCFPLYARATNTDADTIFTSDPKYNYIPYEGRLTAQRIEASQGIVYNNNAVSLDYTFPLNDNATSCGPLTLTAAITVPTGSEWAIL
jgi:hypothetical protein